MANKLPDNLRAFDDMDSARKWMRDGALEALKKRFPIEDDTYRLELADPHYEKPDSEYGLKRQKEALLKRGYLADSVKGTWRLVDKRTGAVMDERQSTVMRVPYLTNRGTFIYNGNEYSAAAQSRLKNGVYTRRRQSGEIESFYSIKPGTGRNFKMWMEPKTGVFRMNVGQANMPLYPLLKELGVTDEQMAKSWGPEVAAANANGSFDARDMRRYYEKFMGKSPGNLGDGEIREAVRNSVARAEMDPWVVSRTLGLENTSHVGPEVLLRGSQKILNVSRGDEQPDDRNAPMFSRILSPEDFIRERIENDAGRVARTLLFKSRRAGNLSRVPAGALDSYTKEYLIKSRLTQPLEETNPLSLLEQMSRITRMGEGGIGSAEAVTADARDVNLGQLGFVDPIQGPESEAIGIDTRVSHRTFKGKDGQMYGEFRDVRTGKNVYLRPEDMDGKVLAFPGEMANDSPTAHVSWQGKMQEVPKDQVDYEIPSFGHMMSAMTNLNPMPTGVQAARQFYGSKFWGQYMPATKGEVPLVDSVADDGQSFSEYYGRRVGAISAKKPGRVVSINDDTMKVKYDDGTKGEIDLVKNLPMNRLTQMSYDTQLKPGDTFGEGDLLATNNFVDPKTGAFAMGHNLKVAVIPYRGYSHEDAQVFSESAAKRLSTNRLYGFDQDFDNDVEVDRKKFTALFPDKFTKEQLAGMGDNGVAKPGTTLNYGDPIILGVGPKLLGPEDIQLGKLSKALRHAKTDKSTVWEHQYPGVVTDAEVTNKGISVNVKADVPLQVGDKTSSRYGLKGVCGRIVPDDQMPRDPLTNEPYDVLLNPMTILSRVAPNQLMEIGLGKVAKRTGQQYRLPQLPPKEGWAQWSLDRMAEAGVPEKEDVFDPETGKTIPGIMTGYMYTLPFHHLAEKKLSGRGSSGVSYSSDELPVKGGGEGAQAKRMSTMDNTALICHGALDVLKDSQVVRGAKNEEYWKALKLGRPLPEPQVPFVYNKFMNLMKAGGINVMKRGSNNLDLLPMTDKDIEQLSGGAVSEAQMVDKDLNPVKGGLFDTAAAGGLLGKKWTHIDLSEPMPNPVFEEPIRRLLGISQKEFRDILSGRSDLDGEYGGKAIQKALSKIDVDEEISKQKQILRNSKSSKRDNAVKCLGYLTALKKQELSPKDWVITKVPVLPPVFRPVSKLGDTLLQADINELYRDVIESSKALKALRKDLPDRDLQDEREALYDSVQAAFGLGDPITPEGAAKGLKGALRTITGNGSPKFGFYQSRVLSKPMDMVGRGAITPNPNADMDSIGLPEDKAWELYKDFILRRLTRNNVPGLRALEMIEKREPAAKQALLDEMNSRPVLMDRAPTWHKFNILAYRPYLHSGSTVQVSPLILQGINGDFDGDFQKSVVMLAISQDAPEEVRALLDSYGRGKAHSGAMKKGSKLVHGKFSVYPVDLQDFPHTELCGRRKDSKYDIEFYDVPKGLYVFAYDETSRKVVMAEVGGWSIHHGKALEIVTLSGGEQIFTDDDPRGIYGIDASGEFGFRLCRMTPREALERGVYVPVSSQPLVPSSMRVKLDPKTQTVNMESGVEMGFDLGVVTAVLSTRGQNPSNPALKKAFDDAVRVCGLDMNGLSSLSMALVEPDAEEKHLPSWFHSGPKDFLKGLACGLTCSVGSISVHRKGRAKGELLIQLYSKSLRLLRETRRVFGMLGVKSFVSANGNQWMLSVCTCDAKRSNVFEELPDPGMKAVFDETHVSLSDESMAADFIPVPKSAQKDITKWISQKHHCNLYHTIFESCKRGGYITRICGNRIRDYAKSMWAKHVDDYWDANYSIQSILDEHGQDDKPFKVSAKDRKAILDGIEAISPYSANGAGDDMTREARRLAKSLGDKVYPDVLHALSRYFSKRSPSKGLLGEPQYQMFVKMLDSPVAWRRVEKVERTGRVVTGYDLTVPGYETFMSDEGVILSNTVNFHVPVSDKAVKNAMDKMLPSRNLVSLTDLRESMSNPRQEMALGLYALTRPPSNKPPVRFRTVEEAKAAYRQGKIKANDPIVVG